MGPEWGLDLDSSELREWQKHIREALNHLHDPTFLRKSPLATAFGVSARFDTPAAVRSILVDAIAALEPQSDEPPGSRAWEVFQSLSTAMWSSSARASGPPDGRQPASSGACSARL